MPKQMKSGFPKPWTKDELEIIAYGWFLTHRDPAEKYRHVFAESYGQLDVTIIDPEAEGDEKYLAQFIYSAAMSYFLLGSFACYMNEENSDYYKIALLRMRREE